MSRTIEQRQGRLWGYLAASVLIASLCTVAFHNANARADRHPSCANVTTAAECGARLAEAL